MLPFSISFRPARCLAALALLAALPLAQAQPAPSRPDPLDAQAQVPPAVHTSPLATYRRLGDDRRVPWPEANATVNRIGGWRAYAREAQQPADAASATPKAAPPAPAPAPARSGHRH